MANQLTFCFQSSDTEPGEVNAVENFDDSSSSDEEILTAKTTRPGIRLAMKPIGHKPTTFKMDVVDDWPPLHMNNFAVILKSHRKINKKTFRSSHAIFVV